MNFVDIIRNDMKPALGVTEPAAIALACAQARHLTEEEPISLYVEVNSGIYKNAFTCGIPNTKVVGNEYAAALGCWFGNPNNGLMVLDSIEESNVTFCETMIKNGNVKVGMGIISPEISIKALVRTAHDECEALIQKSHTNICFLRKNNDIIKDNRISEDSPSEDCYSELKNATLADFCEFIASVPVSEIEFIKEAYTVNMNLAETGFGNLRCNFTKELLNLNNHLRISENSEKSALVLSSAAAEARVLGLNAPAMSITGSGNHGIICTLPLYAVAKVENYSEETLLRATALSYLITMYIKKYSGILSALCGCAVAAGTGMACALTWMRGGCYDAVANTLYNMANSIVGMICQGGNHGCVMKVITAVKVGFASADLGLAGVRIEERHGIGGKSPEETMRNIGLIAVPGMVNTENTIVEILQNK